MTCAEQIGKEREDNLNALVGAEILHAMTYVKEVVAWTIPNSFTRPLRAIVKDENGDYRSMEHSPFPYSWSEPKWHNIYPYVVKPENVRGTMEQFAWAGYDNAEAEIHWLKAV